MKKTLFAALLPLSLTVFADRTLNREAADKLYVSKESLKPQTAYVAGESTSVTTRPFATTTLRAAAPRDEDEDMTAELFPADSRNYDVFLPDDAKTRTLLPIALRGLAEGTEFHFATSKIETLPAFVHVREPSPGLVIITVETVR